MFGDQSTLSMPLQAFWSPPASRQRSTVAETDTELGFCESVWEELVSWFEQQREWAELVACMEG